MLTDSSSWLANSSLLARCSHAREEERALVSLSLLKASSNLIHEGSTVMSSSKSNCLPKDLCPETITLGGGERLNLETLEGHIQSTTLSLLKAQLK